MKRMVFLVLSAALIFAFCACGNATPADQIVPVSTPTQAAIDSPTPAQTTPALTPAPTPQPSPSPTVMPTATLEPTPSPPSLVEQSWGSSAAFQDALTAQTWIYIDTVQQDAELSVPGYEDMSISSASERSFLPPETLRSVRKDGETIIKEYDQKYQIDDTFAYVWFGEYQGYMWDPNFVITDPLPDMRMVYYIDSEGYLIQMLMVYSFQTGQYTRASDANVYAPDAP